MAAIADAAREYLDARTEAVRTREFSLASDMDVNDWMKLREKAHRRLREASNAFLDELADALVGKTEITKRPDQLVPLAHLAIHLAGAAASVGSAGAEARP